MSVLVYTESEQGKFRKNAFEVSSYAHSVAKAMGTTATAVTINNDNGATLGTYGINKVLSVSNDAFDTFNARKYSDILVAAARAEDAKVIILSSSADTKYMAPFVAAALRRVMFPTLWKPHCIPHPLP